MRTGKSGFAGVLQKLAKDLLTDFDDECEVKFGLDCECQCLVEIDLCK